MAGWTVAVSKTVDLSGRTVAVSKIVDKSLHCFQGRYTGDYPVHITDSQWYSISLVVDTTLKLNSP